ncbi:hypothetical protein BH20ACT23_BH20ACT23_31200 [soil metagenome]
MGFWHTGYMEFHEPTGWGDGPRAEPLPPEYPCAQCDQVFLTPDDLAVHLFDGHVTSRPILTLRGRECGRSRLSVISSTEGDDWSFRNFCRIRVNGRGVAEDDAKTILSSSSVGVVSVVLEGERADQEFEFSFTIANEADLRGVDDGLHALVRGRSLTINAIEAFFDRTATYATARRYRDGFANYFYGVLAREGSNESGLRRSQGDLPAYTARFDEAVATLGEFDRPPAEAICGLVAFHYNQFDLALRKTRSPRVSRVARRLASLLAGGAPDHPNLAPADRSSLDYVLSDTETEKVLAWSALPLDGSANESVNEIEAAINAQQPSDALKLRIIAAEHYLAVAAPEAGLRHVAAVRHSAFAERWATSYRDRLATVTG